MYLMSISGENKTISHSWKSKIKWFHGTEPKAEHQQYLTKKGTQNLLLFRFNIRLYTNHFAHLRNREMWKFICKPWLKRSHKVSRIESVWNQQWRAPGKQTKGYALGLLWTPEWYRVNHTHVAIKIKNNCLWFRYWK